MNGMQYMRPKFTLPASEKTSQERWDFAMLSREEFEEKYGQKRYQELSAV